MFLIKKKLEAPGFSINIKLELLNTSFLNINNIFNKHLSRYNYNVTMHQCGTSFYIIALDIIID